VNEFKQIILIGFLIMNAATLLVTLWQSFTLCVANG